MENRKTICVAKIANLYFVCVFFFFFFYSTGICHILHVHFLQLRRSFSISIGAAVFSRAAWFYDAFHVFLVEPRNTIKAQLIQARGRQQKKINNNKRISMLVYYCNKNKRVVLSVILVFLCGINYICGEKKACKATKQISVTICPWHHPMQGHKYSDNLAC